MQTWAVVFPAPDEVTFARIEVPAPRDDEVLVRADWSWISNGTEASYLRGERADGESPATAGRPAPFPIVAGYQKVGTVMSAGAGTDYQPGERVFATISRLSGLALEHGGHVLVAPVHHQQVYRLPADGPPAEAYAGLVLTQVGTNCGLRPTLQEGDPVVVIGDGLVGHWAAQTARAQGAVVLLLGRHDARLARFTCRAGDRVFNSRQENDSAAVQDWAPGGIQALIDTVGSVPTLERLFPALHRGGHLVSAGYHHAAGRIDIQLLRRREAYLHAPSGWSPERMRATLEWIHDATLETLGLVTDRLPADQAAEAWRRIRNQRERTLGVLLDWREVE